MSRKLITAIAVLCFAFSGSLFAAVENIKVSGDTSVQAITRNLSLGASAAADQEDFIFSQIRLRFDSDLTEGVSTTIRLINERIWGNETDTGSDTEVQLDLGYIELKEFLYEPLTIIVGRQNLRYGQALIVGDVDTNQVASAKMPTSVADLSLRKSFDAVRAIFDYDPYTLDLIYAKPREGALDVRDDITLWGANLAYSLDSHGAVAEAYFFGSKTRGGAAVNEDQDSTYTVGTRAMVNLSENLTLGLEGVYQFGDSNQATVPDRHLDAFVIQFISEYRFLDKYKTKVGFDYTYLSGDDPSTANDEAWDPMFEDQIPAELMNIFLAQTGFQLWGFSSSFMPAEDITLGLRYAHGRYVEGNINSIIAGAAGSAIAGNFVSANIGEKHLGDEVDVYAVYDYTEDVQLKLNGAILKPGKVFTFANDNTTYSVRAGINVNF